MVEPSKTVNELQSRVKAKRKEGYKELSEIKDNSGYFIVATNGKALKSYLETYLRRFPLCLMN